MSEKEHRPGSSNERSMNTKRRRHPTLRQQIRTLAEGYGRPAEQLVEIRRPSHSSGPAGFPLSSRRTAEVVLIVPRPDDCVLVHTKEFYPSGIWRLPTGGIQRSETIERALRREAVEETGRLYMLAENYCYHRSAMMVLNMVKQGVFGDLTYAECGYVHDCRAINFKSDGSLTWRGELARDNIGNLYPTHPLGPVARWMGINRTDRLVSLVSMTTRQASIERYAAMRFGEDSPPARVRFSVGDSTSTLIRTANGAVIELRYDTASARPHPTTTYFALQGLKASYESRGEKIWIEGASKGLTWEPLSEYADKYEHPVWTTAQKGAAGTGHGGIDVLEVREFIKAVREGGPSPIDVYDAVTWSSIIPLSAASIRGGGKAVDIPDFTRGKWKKRRA